MANFNFRCSDGTGTKVDESTVKRAIESALKAIEHELPEEARVRAVYHFVLEECKTAIDVTGRITLN